MNLTNSYRTPRVVAVCSPGTQPEEPKRRFVPVRNSLLEDVLRESLQAVEPASAQAEAVRDAIKAFHDYPGDWKAARRVFPERRNSYCV
jgi:hypothetical protein